MLSRLFLCLPQIAALALRSGNGLLLKGGKEAARSNAILHKVIVDAIGSQLGADLIHLVTSRDEIAGALGWNVWLSDQQRGKSFCLQAVGSGS